MMAELLLFDVNETLLDLRALAPAFKRAFGTDDALPKWFSQLLRLALVATITDNYADFTVLGADALTMVANRNNSSLSDAQRQALLAGMRRLPPHTEVVGALTRLRNAGFRMAALTNSPPTMAKEQLTNAGLAPFFERILSVHPTRRFKPAPEPYLYAARELSLLPARIRMIAAHDWDVAGALSAGCQAAFIARPGMVMGNVLPKPTLVGSDLMEIADQLIA